MNTSIWTAAAHGDVERVKKIVTKKGRRPDILDPHGYTPLHLAAQNGRLAVVQYLLDAGATPDGVTKEAGGCGATPLHRAAFAGQLSCVRALLAAGAQPSATDSSFLDMKTPLHKAASQGHRDVCIALMEAGADPNACDASGNTALDVLYLSSSEYLLSPPIPPNPSPESIEKRRGDGTTAAEDYRRVRISETGGTSCTGGWYGEAIDWNGAREALERFGGGRQRVSCRASVGGSSGGAGDGSKDTCLPAVASAAVIPFEGGIPDFQHRGDHQNDGGVVQKTIEGSKEKEVMPHVRTAGGGDGGAGIPCGECRLSKVVMVRPICCGSLVCKSCKRELSARRKSCRRCRDSD